MRLLRIPFKQLLRWRTIDALLWRAAYNVRTLGGRRRLRLTAEQRAACRHTRGLDVRVESGYMQEGERDAAGKLTFDHDAAPFYFVDVAVSCRFCRMSFEFLGVPAARGVLSTTATKTPLCAPGKLELRLPIMPQVPPRLFPKH